MFVSRAFIKGEKENAAGLRGALGMFTSLILAAAITY